MPRSRRQAALPELADAPLAPMPSRIRPMLATLVDQPFDRADWYFELKWDGYRAIAEIRGGRVRLYSRNLISYEDRFAPVVQALKGFPHQAILDGEVVVLDAAGKPHFELLQNYPRSATGRLVYYVFDLLYLDGHNLCVLPLRQRKRILQQVLKRGPHLEVSEHIEERGVAFFHAVSEQGLEGMVAKSAESRYRFGVRSKDWLKIKTHLRQEAVIGGFTAPRGSREHFGSLLLGVTEGNQLKYVGHTGTGFDRERLADLYARMKPLFQKECPFSERPKTNAPPQWVKPTLVCEVNFSEWTDAGLMRHPSFLGLRPDKAPKDVHRESAVHVHASSQRPRAAARRTQTHRPLSVGVDGKALITIDGHDVRLTNANKVFWPDEGYTKGDVINYYRSVAPVILPYLRDRPMSLHRHPNGIAKPSFFQKNVSTQPPPEWVKTVEVEAETRSDRPTTYILCQDEATLVYIANLGCIELNPWQSRVGSLDNSDFLILDLDPQDLPFEHVVETAQVVRATLESLGVQAYCKTSGQRGLHVCVPLGARYEYELTKQFAELIARVVHGKLPSTTSLMRMPAQRRNRVYLDYVQNGRGKTIASVYSLRPQPGAPVSTPLKWSEVRRGLDPMRFTIKTIARRIDKVGDLWAPVLGPGIDLMRCLERLAQATNR